MPIHPSLNTALSASSARVFTALRVALNTGATINLIDGLGEVTFPVNGTAETFKSKDSTYGVIGQAGSIEERVAEQAPRFKCTMLPPDEAGAALWSDIRNQGSSVMVWFGAVSEITGAVIGTPELLWSGRLDTVQTTIAENVLVLDIDSISAYERLFVAEEAARLNGVWHQSIWAGETGLDYVYETDVTIYWGIGNDARNGGGGGSGGPNNRGRQMVAK